MKNLVLIFACIFPLLSFSQTLKGDLGVGGMVGAGYYKTEYAENFNLSIAPDIGYFPFNNFLLGAQLGYSYYFSEYEIYPGTLDTRHSHHYTLGPLARYYLPITPRWNGIFHAGYVWNWNFEIEDDETFNFTNFQLGLGTGYFIAKNVALEGMFYLEKKKQVLFQAGLQVYLVRYRSGQVLE